MHDGIERRLHELRETAARYAEARGNQVYLDHFRKSKLAMLMRAAELDGQKTVAAQEREAYADPEYVELLRGIKVATEEAERLRWELEIARMGAELWRTEQANERAERSGYGVKS